MWFCWIKTSKGWEWKRFRNKEEFALEKGFLNNIIFMSDERYKLAITNSKGLYLCNKNKKIIYVRRVCYDVFSKYKNLWDFSSFTCFDNIQSEF